MNRVFTGKACAIYEKMLKLLERNEKSNSPVIPHLFDKKPSLTTYSIAEARGKPSGTVPEGVQDGLTLGKGS